MYFVLGTAAIGFYFYKDILINGFSNVVTTEDEVNKDVAAIEKETKTTKEDVSETVDEALDTSEDNTVEEKAYELENTDTQEEKADLDVTVRPGPYYSYTMPQKEFKELNLYSDPSKKNRVDQILHVGDSGYATIQSTYRTLIQLEDGSFAWASTYYLTFTEVSEDEYPDELKTITEDNWGSLFE